MFIGYVVNHRQPEIAIMATETGTMSDNSEISTKKSGFSTMTSLVKVSASDCDSIKQLEIAKLANRRKFSGVGHCRNFLESMETHLSSSPWSKTRDLSLKFQSSVLQFPRFPATMD